MKVYRSPSCTDTAYPFYQYAPRALLSRTEGLLYYTATLDVLQLGSYESCALSRLNMLEFDNLVNIVIILNGNTISEITCRNHIKSSS